MSLFNKKSKRASAASESSETPKAQSLSIAMSIARMARKKDKMQSMAQGGKVISPHLNSKEAKASTMAEAIRAKRIKNDPASEEDEFATLDDSGKEVESVLPESQEDAFEEGIYDVGEELLDAEDEEDQGDGSIASEIRKRMKSKKSL